VNAANCYEQLTLYYPDVEDYRVYYAQSLYQACLYEEAMKVTVQIDNPQLKGKVKKDKRPVWGRGKRETSSCPRVWREGLKFLAKLPEDESTE